MIIYQMKKDLISERVGKPFSLSLDACAERPVLEEANVIH